MPKYIQRRGGRERKEHKVIQGIEHKYCGGCKKLKPLNQFGKRRASWDGKHSYCKPCENKKNKQRRKVIKENRKKERKAAPSGFSICLNPTCIVKGLQPVDQFIGEHVRNDKSTSFCLTCRNNSKEDRKQRYAACQKVWDDWRREHPCVKCMNDPNYEHNYLLIEADHLPEFEKVVSCSQVGYWSVKCRGPAAQKDELMKCQALCVFHHALVTQQRDYDNGRIQKQKSMLRKRIIINAEKHKRECCLTCKRIVKKGEERAFDFDHRDPTTKFKYQGKTKGPTAFVELPQTIFDKQWPLEQAKCDLLCRNCHKLKDNRDGYRK